MKIQIGELETLIPFSCLFEEQKSYLEYLYERFQSQETIAVEIPHNQSKNAILLSFLIAYISSPHLYSNRAKQFQQATLYTTPTLYYLPKTHKNVELSLQKAKEIQTLRQSQLPTKYKHINITSSFNRQFHADQYPTLHITTQLQFLNQVRDNDNLIKGRVIIFFSQVSTLDIDCENALSYEINETMLRRAVMEKRYLEKKVYYPTIEEEEYQYRQILASKKEGKETQFLNHYILLINSIEYIIGFLKFKQKQLELGKAKKSFSRKLTEVMTEWTKELSLSPLILEEMQEKFLEMLKERKVSTAKVHSILSILRFLRNLVVLSEKYESIYQNAFKFIINHKDEETELFSFQLCCFQPRIIFNKLQYYPMKQKLNEITLVLASSTPIHTDFFLNNFHRSFQSKSFFSPEISQKSILAMMINSNAFVDLKSDDYQSDTHLQIQRSFGTLLIQFASVITDGIVVYVSSVRYLSALMDEWKKEKIIDSLTAKKYVFFQSEKEQQNKINIKYFKEVCDVGRGGIFFFTCRSKPSEIQQLKGHYSNAIIFIGYPKLNTLQIKNKQKLDYLKSQKSYWKDQFLYLQQQAMRHVNKCLCNCVTSNKMEKKIVLFVDSRFNSRMIPSWVSINEGNLNINESIERSVQFSRHDVKREIKEILAGSIYR